jgi:hypothetical protein
MQLVVRKLLTRNILKNSVSVKIAAGGSNPRYSFDNIISVWLNRASKNKTISNFKQSETSVYFDVEHSLLEELESIIPKEFKFKVIK